MATQNEITEHLHTAVKVTGEVLVPGGSNLVKGDFQNAWIYTVLGFAAKSVFGLPGLLAVSADSLSKAVTDRHLHEHLGLAFGQQSRPAEPSDTKASKD